ncbi:MAG: hemerythrin domain-containing protein [Nonomuraea sp.]|nr:hemerythrin domain-containing protein [Nonomuraea sp.]
MAPNLLGMKIGHRAMRGDARRLADLMGRLANGDQRADAARRAAIGSFADKLCAGIHHHHTAEDAVLWPVIVRSAGDAVDLSELTDDHAQLDPLLEEIRRAAAVLKNDPSAAVRLATGLAALADLLDEHIEEEERLIFPIIEKYVSEEDWELVEQAVRKGGDIAFDLPRIGQYATEPELGELRRLAGPLLSLVLVLLRPGHRRRQQLIFGTA